MLNILNEPPRGKPYGIIKLTSYKGDPLVANDNSEKIFQGKNLKYLTSVLGISLLVQLVILAIIMGGGRSIPFTIGYMAYLAFLHLRWLCLIFVISVFANRFILKNKFKTTEMALLCLCVGMALLGRAYYAWTVNSKFESVLQKFDEQQNKTTPYYGFYKSELGENFKHFEHNLFGFYIDIPTQWNFGVLNQSNISTIMIYPEGLNTSKFSKDYEMLEIGSFDSGKLNLQSIASQILVGMESKHKQITLIQNPKTSDSVAGESVSFKFKWDSTTGHTIYEYVTLLKTTETTWSITFRTTFDPDSKQELYAKMLKSFRLKPAH